MVISATTRLIGRLALRKAKDVTKKVVGRGKDAVRVKKTQSVRTQSLGKKQLEMNMGFDVTQRRRIVTSKSKLSPIVVRKSDEVLGDPMEIRISGVEAPRTISTPSIRETVVSVKGAPKKIIAYKQKDQLESGHSFSSGLGGDSPIDFEDYPVRTTSVVFGLGIRNKPMAESSWGIVGTKRAVEVVKHEGMEEMGDPYTGGWKSFHISGIRATGGGGVRKGVGVKVVKDSGDFDWRKEVYTFGKLTTGRKSTIRGGFEGETISTAKPTIKPSLTIEHHFDIFPAYSTKLKEHDFRDVEHLTIKFGTESPKPKSNLSHLPLWKWPKKERKAFEKWQGNKYTAPGQTQNPYKFYTTFKGTHSFTTRIPTRHTRKKIKRIALPAFAATPTGFIFYSGIKPKDNKKKKGIKR